ncbi:uridine kinase family protein [Roseivirga sp.]|uniref:uridine kinase family protein n=1 Tax=Roseivirga sp. TaxID=1964215 RepID=UPI003B516D91
MSQLVLIAGVSRSGKSSLAKELCSRLNKAVHLDQDNFVKEEDEIPLINDRIDWETPESINWAKWTQAIAKATSEHDYVIAEGIFTLSDLQLVKQADISILLSIDEVEFKKRRHQEKRWGAEPDWFIQHVWNAHLKNHNPHQIIADFELQDFNDIDIQKITERLR